MSHPPLADSLTQLLENFSCTITEVTPYPEFVYVSLPENIYVIIYPQTSEEDTAKIIEFCREHELNGVFGITDVQDFFVYKSTDLNQLNTWIGKIESALQIIAATDAEMSNVGWEHV